MPTAEVDKRCFVYAIVYNGIRVGREALKRVPGVEPGHTAWEADALPLSYTRCVVDLLNVKTNRRQEPIRTAESVRAPRERGRPSPGTTSLGA